MFINVILEVGLWMKPTAPHIQHTVCHSATSALPLTLKGRVCSSLSGHSNISACGELLGYDSRFQKATGKATGQRLGC